MNETFDVSSRVRRDVSTKYYIYILYSLKDKGLYIGFTANLKSRLQEHAKGQSTATKLRRPFKLIHYEYFIDKVDAKAREEFLKSGYGRKQLDQILKRTFKQYLKTASSFAFRKKRLIEKFETNK